MLLETEKVPQTDNSQVKISLCFTDVVESNAAIAALIVFVLRSEVDGTRITVHLNPVSAVNSILIVVLPNTSTLFITTDKLI